MFSILIIPLVDVCISVKIILLCCILGLDVPKHGEPAYPSEAFGDGWGNYLDSNMSPVTSNGKHGKKTISM